MTMYDTKAEEQRARQEATTYSIFRIGNDKRRVYQVNKLVMGVRVEWYSVTLRGSSHVFCNCPGFQRQKFPAIEHKHVQMALDFHERGEPPKALYRIHGAGAKAKIEYLGQKATGYEHEDAIP